MGPQPGRSDLLRSVGDQFLGRLYPVELDLPETTSSGERAPRIIVSTSSWETNEIGGTPFPKNVVEGPPSVRVLGTHQSARPPDAVATSVKSEGYTGYNANSRLAFNSTSSPLLLSEGHARTPGTGVTSMVEHFCNLVQKVSDAWTMALAHNSSVQQRLSAFIVPSVLEAGLRALQKCFGTNAPSTFKELYSLAHLALASACSLHSPHIYDWDALAEDLLRCGQLIELDTERAFYQDVLRQLWNARCISGRIFGEPNGASRMVCSRRLEPAMHESRLELLKVLDETKVVSQCVKLLDSRLPDSGSLTIPT